MPRKYSRYTVGERAFLLRRRMRVSCDEMARLLRVCRRTLYRLESGQRVKRALVDRFLILERRKKGRQ